MLIDLEPIALFFLTGEPAHPWLHTLPGAIAVATLAAIAGPRPCRWFLAWWNRQLDSGQVKWLAVHTAISGPTAWTSALLGTISHILLDAFMHLDVRPFWPFVSVNPLQALIGIEQLQWACIAAGVLGIGILAILRRTVR
jgi:hypothetical protein